MQQKATAALHQSQETVSLNIVHTAWRASRGPMGAGWNRLPGADVVEALQLRPIDAPLPATALVNTALPRQLRVLLSLQPPQVLLLPTDIWSGVVAMPMLVCTVAPTTLFFRVLLFGALTPLHIWSCALLQKDTIGNESTSKVRRSGCPCRGR